MFYAAPLPISPLSATPFKSRHASIGVQVNTQSPVLHASIGVQANPQTPDPRMLPASQTSDSGDSAPRTSSHIQDRAQLVPGARNPDADSMNTEHCNLTIAVKQVSLMSYFYR
jgi:hypothetical protein